MSLQQSLQCSSACRKVCCLLVCEDARVQEDGRGWVANEMPQTRAGLRQAGSSSRKSRARNRCRAVRAATQACQVLPVAHVVKDAMSKVASKCACVLHNPLQGCWQEQGGVLRH
jgi:hypothetical protein